MRKVLIAVLAAATFSILVAPPAQAAESSGATSFTTNVFNMTGESLTGGQAVTEAHAGDYTDLQVLPVGATEFTFTPRYYYSSDQVIYTFDVPGSGLRVRMTLDPDHGQAGLPWRRCEIIDGNDKVVHPDNIDCASRDGDVFIGTPVVWHVTNKLRTALMAAHDGNDQHGVAWSGDLPQSGVGHFATIAGGGFAAPFQYSVLWLWLVSDPQGNVSEVGFPLPFHQEGKSTNLQIG